MTERDCDTPRPGALRDGLIDAVPLLLARGGIGAVTTRACARLQGVAPSTVFRHFRDKRALMTAFAVRGYHELARRLEEGLATAGADPVLRFRKTAECYLDFALEDEDRFRTMFRHELVDLDDPALIAAARALDLAMGVRGFEIGGRESDCAALTRAAVHGLACLTLDSPLRHDLPRGEERRAALMMILRRLLPALRA